MSRHAKNQLAGRVALRSAAVCLETLPSSLQTAQVPANPHEDSEGSELRITSGCVFVPYCPCNGLPPLRPGAQAEMRTPSCCLFFLYLILLEIGQCVHFTGNRAMCLVEGTTPPHLPNTHTYKHKLRLFNLKSLVNVLSVTAVCLFFLSGVGLPLGSLLGRNGGKIDVGGGSQSAE